jgi:Flp pilus assembly pilin Flp
MKQTIGFHLKELWQNETGQDLIEYSLLLAFIALAAIALLSSAGGSVKTIWTRVNSSLTSAAS